MPRPPADARLLSVPLDRDGGEALHRQVHRALRRAILDGRLAPWSRLPSTRGLAQEIGVSRNTVLRAYEQLGAEGLLIAAEGSGSRVHPRLPDDLPLAASADEGPAPTRPPRSATARRLDSVDPWIWRPERYEAPFVLGMPSVRHFPTALWKRLLARRLRQRGMLSPGDALGSSHLRRALCDYLRSARGVDCEPEQILVVDGSQQGLDLIARLLVDPGDEVWMEDPGYLGARWALQAAGARIVGIPVDEEGLDVDAFPPSPPRLIYVTPSDQFPLGVSMSMGRRLELLRRAEERNCWIVEDDYDSEFRTQPHPATSLQGLDRSRRVLYIGTFSKTLTPSLRIGYLVLPPDLVEPFSRLRFVASNQFVPVDQEALGDLLAEGHFATHVARMRRVYRRRRECLLEALATAPPGMFRVAEEGGGMHQVVRLPDTVSETAVAEEALRHGVRLRTLERFRLQVPSRPGLVLGYASVPEEELRRGVAVLIRTVRELDASSERSGA